MGVELAHRYYPAWGYAGHWDGHTCNPTFFPYWLVPAIQWATDTRDPLSSGHGYVQNVMHWSPVNPDGGHISWDRMRAIAVRLYGENDADAFDPYSGYKAKAGPTVWHINRSAIKDCVPVDDNVFPRFFSLYTEDQYARADDMEGPAFEYHMFAAATGVDWSEEEFNAAAERVVNLERAIEVRRHGRGRLDDEYVIPYFERPESWVNPLLGQRQSLDATRFRTVLDEYYTKRGWDVSTGVPTRGKLQSLGMNDVGEALEATVSSRL